TGRDELDRVWRGLETALEKGFDRVKINSVPIRGLNDPEVLDIARLSLDLPVEVRFIEFMPLGLMDFWTPEKMVSSQELKLGLEEALGPLSLIPHRQTEGPARVFQWPGAKGTLGFISPVTDHFCAACNRLRLTADGKLRLCLLSNLEFDLKEPLRRGASPDELAGLLKQAVAAKPADYFLDQKLRPARSRSMNLIGG
ncbi:MAG: GTP 3',8-cyclase MoaA, partial [Pseudomonadota bacterium]